ALNADQGPLQELLEAQQNPRSARHSGKIKGAEVTAQVQTWDVLADAQGLLDALQKKDGDSVQKMQSLKRTGQEAAKQLESIATEQTKAAEKEERKASKGSRQASKERATHAVGCQTVFRLGGMAWHANPAVQKLLEELMKVTSTGPTSDPEQLNQLETEVQAVMAHWQKHSIDKPRQRQENSPMPPSRSSSRKSYNPPAPASPPTMLEADMASGAQRKQVETPELPASWGSFKRGQLQVEMGTSAFQSSTFDSPSRGASKSSCAPSEEGPSPKEPKESRKILRQQGSRRSSLGSEGQSSEPLNLSISRRRREGSHTDSGAGPDAPVPGQPEDALHGDLLDQLEHLKPEGRDRRPSSARLAGPGDGSLLVPHNETSRASSPSSNGQSAPMTPRSPRRLDPIRRGPPLPSAGQLLLGSGPTSPTSPN
ncbi:unnamed protein product, partial [Effrenium voratum]